ncbi:MAG: nucleotide exchange factor GrpE [Chlamydiae bacterium]|nr:nucleotide exchange factor GrpE [Chlamydiota bacterium]
MTDNKQQDIDPILAEETSAPIEEPLSEEQRLQKELKEAQDKYLRALAEMENMRKRLQKEKIEYSRFAVEGAILDFLTPLDNLENALQFAKSSHPEVANWATGFQMILEQFKEALSSQGISPFTSQGASFDPLLHEAIETEETENGEDGLILQEYAKGYRSKERTIRPAKVKVARKKSPPQENSAE